MYVTESNFSLKNSNGFSLPMLKTTVKVFNRKKSPKHFLYKSKKFQTSAKVCNGHFKPISKIFNLDIILP